MELLITTSLIILTVKFTFNVLPLTVETDWVLCTHFYTCNLNITFFFLVIQTVSFLYSCQSFIVLAA